MMKKWMAVFGTLCIFLAACTPGTPTESGIPTETELGTPTETKEIEQKETDGETGRKAAVLPDQDYANSLAIIEPGLNGDCYGQAMFSVPIVSTHPIDPQEVQVELTGITNWEYHVEDYNETLWEEAEKMDFGAGGSDQFSQELYMTYQGIDWKHMGALEEKYNQASDALNAEETKQAKADLKACNSEMQTYLEEYCIGWPENARFFQVLERPFYSYDVSIALMEPEKAETLEQLRVTVGDVTEEWSDFQLRVHPRDVLTEQLGTFEDLGNAGRIEGPYSLSHSQYSMTLAAEEDTVLTEFSLLENCEIRDLHVLITDSSGQMMDLQWDGNSPLLIPAGSSAEIRSFLFFPEQPFCAAGIHWYTGILKGTIQGEERVWCTLSTKVLMSTPYVYAAAFLDGVPIEDYYRYVELPRDIRRGGF